MRPVKTQHIRAKLAQSTALDEGEHTRSTEKGKKKVNGQYTRIFIFKNNNNNQDKKRTCQGHKYPPQKP